MNQRHYCLTLRPYTLIRTNLQIFCAREIYKAECTDKAVYTYNLVISARVEKKKISLSLSFFLGSVLSAEESCCAWLCASHTAARACVRALAACAPRAPLAVRLAYTLGNMAAADSQARINVRETLHYFSWFLTHLFIELRNQFVAAKT